MEPMKRLKLIKRTENIERSETDVKEDTKNHQKPRKINGAFNDKCIEYKSK